MISFFQNAQGIIGVLVGGGITFYTNLKLSEKKYLNDKKNKIFESNFNILQEMKINNLEITFVINNKRGYKLIDSKKSSVETHQEFIDSIPVYSFDNLKLAHKLVCLEKEGESLLNLVSCLHNKMLEMQKNIVNCINKEGTIIEAKELISRVNEQIEIVVQKMSHK